MAQNFTAVPATTLLKDSLVPLLDRDEAVASSFAGTAFPSSNLYVGMVCHRTDQGKRYVLIDLTPTWVETDLITGGVAIAPAATRLATPRAFSITGDVTATGIDFDGTGAVALAATVVQASSSVAGKVELATNAETATGTDATRAVTPAGLKSVTDGLATKDNPTFTGSVVLPDGSVGAAQIASNAVTSTKIADLSVTSGKMAAGAVTSTKIADGAVTNSALATDSVTASKIAAGAVNSSEIANGAIDNVHIATATIGAEKFQSGADEATWVGEMFAALGTNDIGAPMLLIQKTNTSTTLSVGSVVSGANLVYAGFTQDGSVTQDSSSPSGQWESLTAVNEGAGHSAYSTRRVALFKRVE